VLYTELDDYCDKLGAGERRSSEVLSTSSTDDGKVYRKVYRALSIHLSPAKLIARSTIDMPWRNLLSPEF